MARLGWEEQHLTRRLKSDPGKLAIAARLRTETTLPLKWIGARLQMGTTKSTRPMLHHWMHYHAKQPCTQLQFQPMGDPFQVEPTIRGIRDGRDEVLERVIAFLKGDGRGKDPIWRFFVKSKILILLCGFCVLVCILVANNAHKLPKTP